MSKEVGNKVHRLDCFVENKPGVLARIVGLISGRGYNIQTLEVGPTDDGTVSRMKIDVLGSVKVVRQIILQLRNQVNVIEVSSRRSAIWLISALASFVALGDVSFDAGADLRMRQEFYDDVPGLPGGGLLSKQARGKYVNRMRFRPRVWGEIKFEDRLRLYMRLADEFRWNVQPNIRSSRFPDEVFLDNLYVQAQGLFDGFFDFTVGRQDVYKLYGLEHIFQDATPNDGSRSLFADMARFTLNFTDVSKLDVFGLYLQDDNHLRWGNSLSDHRSLTGLGASGAEAERDEWGAGAVWSSEICEDLPYQLYAMHKNTRSYKVKGSKRPSTRIETLGAKITPKFDDEWSLEFEGIGQIGETGEGSTLYGWSSYAGVNWRESEAFSGVKPFASAGLLMMSGSKDVDENGYGRGAWDPMWSRSVRYSEIFLYGTHYATCWWSNLYYAKMELGLDLGKRHNITFTSGPMFAAERDGLGGGDGAYKGYLNTLHYNFPLLLADREKGERFEIFGHIHVEAFNPGDYFKSDAGAWFVRWQLEFKF